jgi:hypothetical protein
MRTTVNLDDDVYQAVLRLARRTGISFGKALSNVARDGLEATAASKTTVLPTFDVPPGAPMIPGMLAYKFLDEEGAF